MDGGTFSAINTTFKFVEFCYKLRDVPEENKVFCRLIQRVRDDLEECLRVMRLPAIQAYFQTNNGEKTYIEGTVTSVRLALASIGKFVESVRVDEERNGSIGLYNRFEWVIRHQTKLLTRQLELDTCHKSLLQAISDMKLAQHMTPVLPSYGEAVEGRAQEQPDDALAEFLNARNRRARKDSRRRVVNLIDVDIQEPAPSDGNPPPFDHQPPNQAQNPPAVDTLPPNQGPTLNPPSPRPAMSSPLDNQPRMAYMRSELDSPSWMGSRYLAEPETIQQEAQRRASIAELALSHARPNMPELRSDPVVPHPQRHPYSSHGQSISISSLSLSSFLSPPETESSDFPSAPPTPFFPPARPHSSYGDSRQRASSLMGSMSELGLHEARRRAPEPTYPTSWHEAQYQGRHDAVQNWLIPVDHAANAPEVVPAHQITHHANTYPYPGLMVSSHDSCLPEVAPAERQSSLPEVIHPRSQSATKELREKRRARLNLIAGD